MLVYPVPNRSMFRGSAFASRMPRRFQLLHSTAGEKLKQRDSADDGFMIPKRMSTAKTPNLSAMTVNATGTAEQFFRVST